MTDNVHCKPDPFTLKKYVTTTFDNINNIQSITFNCTTTTVLYSTIHQIARLSIWGLMMILPPPSFLYLHGWDKFHGERIRSVSDKKATFTHCPEDTEITYYKYHCQSPYGCREIKTNVTRKTAGTAENPARQQTPFL